MARGQSCSDGARMASLCGGRTHAGEDRRRRSNCPTRPQQGVPDVPAEGGGGGERSAQSGRARPTVPRLSAMAAAAAPENRRALILRSQGQGGNARKTTISKRRDRVTRRDVMSTLQPISEMNDLTRYAPKWARDPAEKERRKELRLGDIDRNARESELNLCRVEDGIVALKNTLVIDGIEVPPSLVPASLMSRSLEPRPVPPLSSFPSRSSRSKFWLLGPLFVAVSLAVPGLLLVWQFPLKSWSPLDDLKREFAARIPSVGRPLPTVEASLSVAEATPPVVERPVATGQRPSPEPPLARITEAISASPPAPVAPLVKRETIGNAMAVATADPAATPDPISKPGASVD